MQIVSMKGRFSKLLQDYCVSQIHEKYPSFQFGANNIDINFLRESLLFPQVIDQTGEYQYPYSWALTGELSDGLITISQLRAGDSCINDRGGRNSNTIFSGVFIKYEFNFDIKHPIIILPTKWGNQFDTSLKMKWGSPPFPENFESHDVYKNTKYSIYSNEYSHGANADFWYELITKTNELSESPISISIFDHSLFIAIPWDWDSKAKIFKPNVSLPLEQYINTILEVINILGENYRKV